MVLGWKHPPLMFDSNATPGWKATEATSDLPLAVMVGSSSFSYWTVDRLDGEAISGAAQHTEICVEADQPVLSLLMSASFVHHDTKKSVRLRRTCID